MAEISGVVESQTYDPKAKTTFIVLRSPQGLCEASFYRENGLGTQNILSPGRQITLCGALSVNEEKSIYQMDASSVKIPCGPSLHELKVNYRFEYIPPGLFKG